MQNIIVIYLTSKFQDRNARNLAFEYQDAAALPNLGEYVYFGDPRVKFQITAREHLYQDDETVRILYHLDRPQKVHESEVEYLCAPSVQLEDIR